MGLRDGEACTCLFCLNAMPHLHPTNRCECAMCRMARALAAQPASCGTCRWFGADNECQRRAPMANANPDRDFRRRIFPVMHPTESCGEYERRACQP
jgi:hypothetical protein